MKHLRIISILIVLAGLLACEPPVTFSEPQPTETKNISKFPKRLQGQYLSLSDNSTMLINDRLIQRIYDFDYKLHLNQLDSNSQLSGDTIINLNTQEKSIIQRDGDSIIFHTHFVDTLFQIDYDNEVRKLKGYYFLNTRYNKTGWVVKKMQLTKGQLVISSISAQLDIEQLKAVAESPKDTVPPYEFTVTKKQFKKFIRNDGFSDSEIFVRQKNNAL